MKKTSVIVVGAVAAVGVAGISFGKKIKTLYQSLNSFKDKNLAHTFQHTPEIQPTKKISRGSRSFLLQRKRTLRWQMVLPIRMRFIPVKNLWRTRKLPR